MQPDRKDYFKKYNKEWYAKNKERDNARTSEWRRNNLEKRAAYMRQWWSNLDEAGRERYAAKKRQYNLKRKYGITIEEYDAMLLRQNGHCALCDRTPDQEKLGILVVDHCHDTGHVRGLLCTNHNSAIGRLGDNVDGLMKAIEYLKGGV